MTDFFSWKLDLLEHKLYKSNYFIWNNEEDHRLAWFDIISRLLELHSKQMSLDYTYFFHYE
jgi:hypothetical protein